MKCGRLNSLKGHAEVVEPLVTAMAMMEGEVARIEKKLKELSAGDRAVEILSGNPGTGLIRSTTVRAFIDDLRRPKSTMKLCRYAGLAPCV